MPDPSTGRLVGPGKLKCRLFMFASIAKHIGTCVYLTQPCRSVNVGQAHKRGT